MKGRSIAFAFLVAGLSMPPALHAQTLGEIARKAQEARAKAKEEQAKAASTDKVTPTKEGAKAERGSEKTGATVPKKVYTNNDLPEAPGTFPLVSTAPAPDIDTTAPIAVMVTTPTFEAVYRSAKAVQGATESGVSYIRFRELLQGFSAEVGIARDHQLNAADSRLLALFQRVLDHYQMSAIIWRMKLDSTDAMWNGEIPVSFTGKPETRQFADQLSAEYGIPLTDRLYPGVGPLLTGNFRYQSIPGDAFKKIWEKADAYLARATALFYGR